MVQENACSGNAEISERTTHPLGNTLVCYKIDCCVSNGKLSEIFTEGDRGDCGTGTAVSNP